MGFGVEELILLFPRKTQSIHLLPSLLHDFSIGVA